MDYCKWLQDLNPGDEVAVKGGYIGNAGTKIVKVASVEPSTGNIIIDGNEYKDGVYIDEQRKGIWRLIPLDADLLDEIERKEIISKIHLADFESFTIQKLREILKAIEEARE